MEGVDGSTTFTDLSKNALLVTPHSTAQIDEDFSQFGNGSGLFDGVGAYLSVPFHPDFEVGTGPFTFEMTVRCGSFATAQTLYARSSAANGVTRESSLLILNATIIRFYYGVRGSSSVNRDFIVPTLATNVFLQIAFTRNKAGVMRVFVNGVKSATEYTDLIDLNGGGVLPLYLCAFNYGPLTSLLTGRGNWARFTKGVVRYEATYTPPDFPFY
jgi:hypothetical protein